METKYVPLTRKEIHRSLNLLSQNHTLKQISKKCNISVREIKDLEKEFGTIKNWSNKNV